MACLLSLKILLMSAGVLSVALALKVSVPLAMEFSLSSVSLIWGSLLPCLRPLYVYIIINGIIISIVASTRLHHKQDDGYVEIPSSTKAPEDMRYNKEVVQVGYTRAGASAVHRPGYEVIVLELKAVEEISMQLQTDDVIASEVKTMEPISFVQYEAEDEDKFAKSTIPTWSSPEMMNMSEKPPVSSRFGRRKSAKSSPEVGKALGVVSKVKRHDTLENTWKAITEGRAMPLSRHMKKCETWENHGRQMNVGEVEASPVKKSETFKERTNQEMKLRKEASLGQDELNRRVEDFIRKFNEEMRLQREQS